MKNDITNVDGVLSRKIKALFLASLLLIFLPFSGAMAYGGPLENSVSMTVEQLRALPRSATVIIDTRPAWKYYLGHIPGAVNLPDWRDFTHKVNGVPGLLIEDAKFIADQLRSLGIDKTKTIVIYGDPADPWRTDGRFFWMFERFGFSSAAILTGGLETWKEKDGDVHRGKPDAISPSAITPADIKLNPQVTADSEWIREQSQSDNLAIIDNRTRKEYDGATPYGSVRGGHIPKAIHIPWEEFFTTAGVLKDKENLLAMLNTKGIGPDREIVVYCTGGVRSGMAYYAFRSLGFKVRNYDGSWWDWSKNPELPVELF